jgi:hypothetical protein
MSIRFRTLGRTSQLTLETAEDLASVASLPDALWVATAATVDTLRLDKGFLALVDTDGDGRVRSDEIRASITWALAVFRDRSGFKPGNTTLALASLAETGDGAAVLEGARRILEGSGNPARKELGLDEVRKVRADEEAKGLSSAGKVLLAAAGDDAALGTFLGHVLEVTGGEKHPSGDPAVTQATLDAFRAQGTEWLAWNDRPATDAAILPIPAVAEAMAAHDAVAAKLEQYFLLCDTVHLDATLASRAWIDATSTDLLDPVAAAALLEKAPLARPRADGILEPAAGLNPAWRARVTAWLDAAVKPFGGDPTRLDRAAAAAVAGKVAAFRAWQGARPATKAGDRGVDALRAHIADAGFEVRTKALLAKSETAAVALDGVKLVEKAILLQAWLLPLCNTTVSVPDLFDAKVKGWVERGTLVIDGREFHLAIKVNDPARAERFAAMSPLYTMFVKVGDKGGTLDEEFMVPVTAGEREHLVDGMWGVFFDTDGRERHAQIRKMVANPISIKEAVLAPFRKAGEAIQSALDKAASSQTESMSSSVTSTASAAADKTANVASNTVAAAEAAKAADAAAPAAAPAPAPAATATATSAPPSSLGNLPMLAAGVGIALGAIVAALTQVMGMILGAAAWLATAAGGLAVSWGVPENVASTVGGVLFPVWVLVAIVGPLLVAFLIYATPIAIATRFRLRRRDLATLLEGSGWAINTRLYLDRDLAVQLTARPERPR